MRDEHSIMTVSSYAEGHYGLHRVCIGLPTVLGVNGVEDVIEIPLNEREMELLQMSARTLMQTVQSIGGL